MNRHAHSHYPIDETHAAFHRDELRSIASPGTWGAAAARTAIAAVARRARCDADVQESVGDEALARARPRLADLMGPAAVTRAALTAGVFSLLDRAANGVGIPVEPMVMKPGADFRVRYRIDDILSARNSLR